MLQSLEETWLHWSLARTLGRTLEWMQAALVEKPGAWPEEQLEEQCSSLEGLVEELGKWLGERAERLEATLEEQGEEPESMLEELLEHSQMASWPDRSLVALEGRLKLVS